MDIHTIREEMTRNHRRLEDLNLRVAYYARVSTDKDEQLHSLAAQKYHFENRISDNPNWTLVEGYVDEGVTATTTKNRENFLRMIRDAKLHKFDLIITKEISRFARNTVDSLSYTQDLLRNGVGVLFENDNLNTLEPDSELRLTIMSGMAQDESRKISERVSFGFRKSIESGVVLGNDAIWGYRKENGKLVIVPEEAEMVYKIFDLYANENLGVRAIAKVLTDMGYKNTSGNNFSYSSIKGILVNPKYKGFYCGKKTHKIDFRHNDIKYLPKEEWVMYEDHDAVPPIVSVELWDRANRKLKARGEKMASNDKTSYQNKYLYSGKIVCGEHGDCYHHTIYKYKNLGNKELWACKRYNEGDKCRNPLVYNAEIDAVMREVYNQIICEKTSIINDLLELYKESGSTKAIAKSKNKIQSEIKRIKDLKDTLVELVTDKLISKEEFHQRNSVYNEQLDELEKKLSELDEEEQKSLDLKESIESLRSSIADELAFTEDIGKNVVDSFIDKIVVYKSEIENQIDLKIFLKLLPVAPQNFTETSHVLTFGSGQIIQTRGGNTRSLKAYNLTFNYELCYNLE